MKLILSLLIASACIGADTLTIPGPQDNPFIVGTQIGIGADTGSSLIAPTLTVNTSKTANITGVGYAGVTPTDPFIRYTPDSTDRALYLGNSSLGLTDFRIYGCTYAGTPAVYFSISSSGTVSIGPSAITTGSAVRIIQAATVVGTDLPGESLYLKAPNATGNADGGDIEFWTAIDGGTTGTTSRPATKAAAITKQHFIQFYPGGGATALTVPGSFTTTTTSAGNSAGVETDLMTYTVPGLSVVNSGDTVVLTSWGVFAGNANSKRVIVYFGGVSIFDSTSLVFNDGSWRVVAEVTRTSSTTARACVTWFSSNATLPHYVSTSLALTPTWSSNQIFKLTGNGTSASDVVSYVANWGIRER